MRCACALDRTMFCPAGRARELSIIAPELALRISVLLTMADSGDGGPSRPPGGDPRPLKRKSGASSEVSPTRLQQRLEQAELVRLNLLE